MMTLQHSLADLCEKAKEKWRQLDPEVSVVVSGNDGHNMSISQAVSYIANQLKFQKKVCKLHILCINQPQ